MVIIGAGLAGTAAKNFFSNKSVEVFDSRNKDEGWSHKALMRIRDPALGNYLGCKLKKIQAYKCIYYDGKIYDTYQHNLSNMYSMKVSGSIINRSIDKLGWEERYLVEGEIDTEGVNFNKKVISIKDNIITFDDGSSNNYDEMINTMPLPDIAKVCGIETEETFTKKSRTIIVKIIPLLIESNVNQTVYFPSLSYGLYRATLQENKIIAEILFDESILLGYEWSLFSKDLFKVFGLCDEKFYDLNKISTYYQSNGKLIPINNEYRKYLILELTERFGIYSLGRYATWRNITSEDIIPDIEKISHLMEMGKYGRKYYGKITDGGEK